MDEYFRVRHKHSPTRHGEWKFHLASTTWKSLAKMSSMEFGRKHFGEYEIKLLAKFRYAIIYLYQSYLFQISFISMNIDENLARAYGARSISISKWHVNCMINPWFSLFWIFSSSRLRRSQLKYVYNILIANTTAEVLECRYSQYRAFMMKNLGILTMVFQLLNRYSHDSSK